MNFSPEETNSTSSPIITLKTQTITILFPSLPPIINNSMKEAKKTDFNIINSINNNDVINSSSNNNKINYNTGRWSEEEHLKFIDGILEYGNEWKKVQNLIGTRSSTQARSHAQKFFLKLKKNFNLDNEILSDSNSTTVSPVNNSYNINDDNGNYMKNFFELIYKNKKDKKIKNEKLTLEQKKKIIHLVSKISLHENNDTINNKNNNEKAKKNDLNFDLNKNSMIKIKINDEDDYKIIDNNNNLENIENKMNENNNNKNKKIFKIKKEKNKKNSIHKKFEKKMSFDYNYHYENLLKNDNEDELYALGKKRKNNNNNDFINNNSENNNFFNRHRYNSVEVNSNDLFHNFFEEIKSNPFDINFSIDNFNYNNNNININNNNFIIEENITSNSNNHLISNNNLDNFKL